MRDGKTKITSMPRQGSGKQEMGRTNNQAGGPSTGTSYPGAADPRTQAPYCRSRQLTWSTLIALGCSLFWPTRAVGGYRWLTVRFWFQRIFHWPYLDCLP
jgi:hypothetical protein